MKHMVLSLMRGRKGSVVNQHNFFLMTKTHSANSYKYTVVLNRQTITGKWYHTRS